jgi:hypothetical protein
MSKSPFILVALLLLTACGSPQVIANTQAVTPSRPPRIVTVTPPFVPSVTSTATTDPNVSPTPTGTASPTPTFSPTPTPSPVPALGISIPGCNTSLDVTHGMGEVTNAYPLLRNLTGTDLTDVCATLSASDEDRTHPDKTACAASLPAGTQILLKLTVDTGFKEDTSVRVDVTSAQGFTASQEAASCRDLGFPGWIPDKVGVVEPVP